MRAGKEEADGTASSCSSRVVSQPQAVVHRLRSRRRTGRRPRAPAPDAWSCVRRSAGGPCWRLPRPWHG